MLSRRGLTLTWLAYLVFVAYGSLVPLDFRPLPIDEAVRQFQQLPWLAIGVQGRADWVANGVLYAPLAFLTARVAFGLGLAQALACTLALALCAALAVGVEFAQLFFPPRTVSRNDLLAEWIGSLVGVGFAPFAANWLKRLAGAWPRGGGRFRPHLLGLHLLELYAMGYLALSFFPYDLLLSAAEVQLKWQSTGWGGWLAPSERGAFLVGLQLVVELALSVPIGALLARRHPGGRIDLLAAALAGAMLGLFIECGQFFVASGISQGASVLTRVLGVAAGAWLVPHVRRAGVAGVRGLLRRVALPPLWLVYLPLLGGVNGVFKHAWQGPAAAAAAWGEVRLLPFYYHYYTTEAVALSSLGSVALMYLPAAVLGWAGAWPTRATLAGVALLAAVFEAGKLFLAGLHPDPTNVLIAVGAAAVALELLALLDRAATASARHASAVLEPGPVPAPVGAPVPAPLAAPLAAATRRSGSAWLLALPVVAAWTLAFPVFPWALLALLSACVALVWRWPLLALALLPAALPVLDLAPWSGRFYWDEFDLLSAACLAVALHRTRGAGLPRVRRPLTLTLAFALLALSLLASTVRALWPWPALDDNSFSSYYSAFNALRIVKGAVWAWLFVLLWRRLGSHGAARSRMFTMGMVVGLALTVLAVLWERAAFVGLWDFAADHRVTGLFSAMHKGGAFIECWLAVATAFALAWALRARLWPARATAALLLAGAGYAMMVTYSRNGYAALGVVVVVALIAALVPAWRSRAWRQAVWGAAVLALVAAVAVPIALAPYASSRLAQVGQDLAARQAHWQDGLQLRDDSVLTAVFGMGLGRFPEMHYWRSQEPARAATYRLGRDGERPFLSLGAGAKLYVEQIVARPAPGPLTLSMSLRASPGPAALSVALCEKWILTSLRCASATASAPTQPHPAKTSWQRVEVLLDATTLLEGGAPGRPPLTLALLTPGSGAVDVTDLQLISAAGVELLANGNFAQGMDRWFFATDVDPPWQLDSLPLTVLFDQGWLGVLAWSVVGLGALGAGLRLAAQGRPQVPAALAAVCGFLVSGSLNTLIDAPRFLGLLLVLLWLAAAPDHPDAPA